MRFSVPSRLLLVLGASLVAALLSVVAVAGYLGYREEHIERDVVAYLRLKDARAKVVDDYVPGWQYYFARLLRGRRIHGIFLHGDGIDDASVDQLLRLDALQWLSLDDCAVTDAGMKKIARSHTIRSLALSNCNNISDDSLVYVEGLTELESLDVACNRVTARNVNCLATLRKLGTLSLFGSNITDEAIASLATLKQLDNTLDIRGTGISEEGAKRLQRELPNVLVLVGP